MHTDIKVEVKPTILIADDDSSTRMLLRATISQWDYPVVEASDGEEAWDILNKDDHPQIATVDWMMPKIDGMDLCRRTKQLPKPPYMILLTSMSGAGNLVNALDSGADDFITKPFNYAELRSRLRVGHRIVNFTNRLEEQNPDISSLSKQLSIMVREIGDVSKQIYKEWIALQKYLQNMKNIQLEERLTFKKSVNDLSLRQEQLTEQINHLTCLVDEKIVESDKSQEELKINRNKSRRKT